MKQATKYGFAALLGGILLLGACSKDETIPAGDASTGTLRMHITATRAETDAYDPFDYRTVRIYSDKGLIRKYAPQDEMPAELQLLQGDYRIAVELGDGSEASFTRKSYRGEQQFAIAANRTTQVEVPCKTINVAAEVLFDASIAENFGSDFAVTVCARDAFDAEGVANGTVPALTYTADGTGYFLLPEGVANLGWRFAGTHASKGAVETTGVLEQVKAGNRYTLRLRYSPDKPGYVDFSLTIQDPTEIDDTIIFSPDPTIKGEDFDMTEVQRYVSGGKTFVITTMGTLQSVSVEAAGTVYDLLNPTAAGIASVRTDDYSLTVTFSDDFFAALPAGDTPLQFRVTDADGGSLRSEALFRKQGVVSTAYDPWGCSLTVEAIVFDGLTASLAYRTADGAWQQTAAAAGENDRCTLVAAPEWRQSQNDDGLTVYTPASGTGLFATRTYEYEVKVGDTPIGSGTIATPEADTIENAGMDDWSTYNVVGSSITGGTVPYPNAEGNSFWVGGNNKTTNALCTGNTTEAGLHGTACAQLKPTVMAGVFAAGNLFTGTFACGTGFLDMFGFASFGVKYRFAARPTGLKVRYKATVTKVTNNNSGKGPLTTDDIDPARIFVCITDWTARHAVKSGKTYDESTFWNPNKTDRLAEGPILGYGNRYITESTADWVEEVIPIYWYDTQAAPNPDNFTLSISCVTSTYGDYVTGSENNLLFVEDFEWVY